MMKIIGIATISISTILYSFSVYEKYSLRPKNLNVIIEFLNNYLLELKWHKKSICDAIKAYDTKNEYLLHCRALVDNNIVVDAFFNKNELINQMCLTKDDLNILNNFFKTCGQSNYVGEIEHCKTTIDLLLTQKDVAVLKSNNYGKLCVKLGVIAAAWIFIIFI